MRALVASLLLSSSAAFACACGTLPFSSGVALSPVVFEGFAEGEPFETGYTEYVYSIRVTRVFKGEVADRVFVTTGLACGQYPAPGDRWVFVIHPERIGRLSYGISGCGFPSSLVASLTPAEVTSLGPGYPPHNRPTRVIAAFVLLAFALAGALWRWRRRSA